MKLIRSAEITLFIFICILQKIVTQRLGPFVESFRNDRQNWRDDEILPPNYNKQQPPTVNNTPVIIEVGVSILSFRAVAESSLSFSVDVFFHQYWDDHRLRLPSGVRPDKRIALKGQWKDKLWMPETYFKNALRGSVTDIINPILYFTVTNQTRVFMAARIALELSCNMHFAKYPFDSQLCFMELISMSNPIEIVTYKWKKFEITKNLYLPQFNVEGVSASNCVKSYRDVGTYSCLIAEISLKRNTGNFIIRRYIPSFLIVILSFVGFWIPTNAYPARVTLTITSLLALITQQYHSELNVTYVYALSIWMIMCLTFVFAALLEYAFAISWPFPTGETTYSVSGYNNQKHIQNPNLNGHSHKSNNDLKRAIKSAFKPNLRNNKIDMISRVLFPLMFAVCIIIYMIMYVM